MEEDGAKLLLAFKAVTFVNGKPVSPRRTDAEWSRDGILYATCEDNGHVPPHESCSCGIYATTSRKILRAYIAGANSLLCPVLLVAACGGTEVWSSGWRAFAAQAHYIVNNTGDTLVDSSRTNRFIAIDQAEKYFELPVISMRGALDLIRASWEDCGYTRDDSVQSMHSNPADYISGSMLSFTK